MKYNRPVWELMNECAQDLPDRFRFSHIRQWFEEHYPDVNERTLRVHLIGLTDSPNNPNPALAKKTPLFRRVTHGEYELVSTSSSSVDEEPEVVPSAKKETASTAVDFTQMRRVVLIGHERRQGRAPASARELFVSREFVVAKTMADADADFWFVISSEYGLVDPDAVISPYSRRLSHESLAFCRAWAQWTAVKLDSELDGLADATIEIHTGDAHLEPLAALIESRGARVITPLAGLSDAEIADYYT